MAAAAAWAAAAGKWKWKWSWKCSTSTRNNGEKIKRFNEKIERKRNGISLRHFIIKK